jgi:hypothetical protein
MLKSRINRVLRSVRVIYLGKKGKLPGLLTTMGPSGSIVYGSVMGITFLLLP